MEPMYQRQHPLQFEIVVRLGNFSQYCALDIECILYLQTKPSRSETMEFVQSVTALIPQAVCVVFCHMCIKAVEGISSESFPIPDFVFEILFTFAFTASSVLTNARKRGQGNGVRR